MNATDDLAADLHPLAEQELIEAARFYSTNVSKLGEEFLVEVEHTIARLAKHPASGSPLRPGIRWGFVNRFPFF